MTHRSAVLLAAIALIVVGTATASAQQQQQRPPQQPPRPGQQQAPQRPNPREQVLQRLRSMTTTEKPDTTTPAQDSAAAQRTREQAEAAIQPVTPAVTVTPDSVMQKLLRLPGYSPTEYSGAAAQFRADSGLLYVTGDTLRKATVVRDGQTITADSLLTFNRNTDVACGYGRPVLSGAQAEAPLTSQLVCYNVQTQVGMALGAQTEISEGANWIARGDLATRGQNVYMHDAAFTDCNLEVPHYHFSAGSMKVVNRDVLVARNVTLNFGDVPVLWLPFMMQSLKQGRRSGVLMPRFTINDIFRRNSSANRRIEDVGVYWAASDNLGAELAMDWYANNYTALRGSLDYSWLDLFFNGALTYQHFFREGGGSEMTFSTYNTWEPSERTRLNMNANYASSSRFVEQNTFDPREITRAIDSNVGVAHRFNWGTINASGSRKQFIGDDRVEMTLPQVSLTLNPITLFPELTDPRWYNNLTWTGSTQTRFTNSRVALSPNERSFDNLTAQAQNTFSLGSFSLGSNVDFARRTDHARDLIITDREGADPDTTLAAPQQYLQRLTWSTGLSYQQRLIGTSTITPSLSLGGQFASSNAADSTGGTGGRTVAAPLRLSFRTDLKTDIFGFWPGAGSVERIRHRMSPSFGYTYSPSMKVDTIQEKVFGVSETREQNQLSISLNQTFEAKLRRPRGEAGDTLARDSLAGDTLSLDPSRPRRMQQGDKMTLLGLNTSAVVYDFVAAREENRGFQTMEISNTITSDLLRGLQVNITHELYDQVLNDTTNEVVDRRFSPHLRSLSTSFSISSSSAIFRRLGLGGRDDTPVATDPAPSPVPEQNQAGPVVDRSRPEYGLVGTRRREEVQTPRSAVGSWNASFDITLLRPRERDAFNNLDGSMVTVNLGFQPTQNWNVYWRTGYSISQGDFTDHILSFTRQLHDWDANFDFIKAMNGNFAFSFRVSLRANPDIKFEHEQRDNDRARF